MLTNTNYTTKATITVTIEELNELFIAIGSEMKSTKAAAEHFEELGLSEMERVAKTQIDRLNSIFDKLSEAELKIEAKENHKWYGDEA